MKNISIKKMGWLKAVFIAFDQLLNALLFGWPDETLSSRAYRWHVSKITSWPKRIIDVLFFWEKEHCKASFDSERTDRHLPPEMRCCYDSCNNKECNHKW